MTVAGEGRAPGEPHLAAVAERVGIRGPVARAIVEEVRDAIAGWPAAAAAAGVAGAMTRGIATVLGRALR